MLCPRDLKSVNIFVGLPQRNVFIRNCKDLPKSKRLPTISDTLCIPVSDTLPELEEANIFSATPADKSSFLIQRYLILDYIKISFRRYSEVVIESSWVTNLAETKL